jgi:hypothetical protein
MSRINGMRGIVRKKYGNEKLLKKSRRVSKPASSKRVKKSIKKIKQSTSMIDKARAEIYSMQRSSAQRQKNLLAKAERLGLQETLSKELFDTPVFYDVRTIDTIGKSSRIKNEIQQQRKEWTIATRRIEADIKRVENYRKSATPFIKERNRIINNFIDEADGAMRSNIKSDVLRYTEDELVSGLTGNPTRYYHKGDYYKQRKELRKITFDPYFKTKKYRKDVDGNLFRGMSELREKMDFATMETIRPLIEDFLSMSIDENEAFYRMNVYESATTLLSSNIYIIASHAKEIRGVIQRVKNASRR